MKTLLPHRRLFAMILLAVFAASTFAPAAQAAGHRRWKAGPAPRVVRHAPAPWYGPRVHVVHHSDAAPVIAGIVGGLVLGAILADAHPVVHAQYSYWDPYCDEGFASLELYQSHLYRHHHPRVVRVIQTSNGDCVRDLHWSHGGWTEGDWDD